MTRPLSDSSQTIFFPFFLPGATSGTVKSAFLPSAAFARSSHSICAGERISQLHEAASLIGETKEECEPSRSPMSCQADKRKTAQTKQTQKQTEHPKKSAPIFFFPSCASVALARSSDIVVLMNELSRCNYYVPHWGVESGVGTITQPEVKSGPKHRENQETKKTKKQKNKNHTKTKKQRREP